MWGEGRRDTLEHVSEFKYLGYVLYESPTDEAECSRKVVSGRRVAGPIGLWLMLGFSMSHCSCLLLCMTVRQ